MLQVVLHTIVSIHAPAREATRCRRCRRSAARLVSIHAPAREATRPPGRPLPTRPSFNPRPRAGSDAVPAAAVTTTAAAVSIHAPAREATRPPSRQPRNWPPFQSTPPRGKRLESRGFNGHRDEFQSTPPRGKRHRIYSVRGSTSFNPRPRAGSDLVYAGTDSLYREFQSTPPRGKRRQLAVAIHPAASVSIHAPAREATPPGCLRSSLANGRCFNPRPRAGSDWSTPVDIAAGSCCRFNPRPRAGSDPHQAADAYLVSCFNPRPRAGSDAALMLDGDESARLVSIHAPAREATVPS